MSLRWFLLQIGTIARSYVVLAVRASRPTATRCTSVTSATELGIYDVGRPEAPQRLSRLPLPHLENEDVDVGHIGGRDYEIINDPWLHRRRAIYIIDPAVPLLASATPVEVPGLDGLATQTPGSSNRHIANCAPSVSTCGRRAPSESLTVFDLADPSKPKCLDASTDPDSANDSPLDPSTTSH